MRDPPDLENTTEYYSKGLQALEGWGTGLTRMMDPLGAVYSYFTDTKTAGGIAWRQNSLNRESETDERINPQSPYYILGRAAGVVLGVYMQVSLRGLFQLAYAIGNIFLYRALKKQGLHKFSKKVLHLHKADSFSYNFFHSSFKRQNL